jgi:maleylacetate reductase
VTHFQPSFEAQSAAIRVRFGVGIRADIEAEIDRLGCSRALVLSTPPQADSAMDMAARLNGKAAGVYTKAAMHTPVEVTADAIDHAKSVKADCLVALGGGSTTGLGKAIAYQTDLPQIVIPTTYAGSEATAILGQTENGVKTTVTDPKIQPEVILYDAELVRTLPVPMTVTSALNAMAHAAEALYAVNPIRFRPCSPSRDCRHSEALPRVIDNPDDLEARGETLYGAWLCGTVLGQVGMALHHKLCHTLGRLVRPAACRNARHRAAACRRLQRPRGPDQLQPICDIFGGTNAGASLHAFAQQVGAPMALKDLGLKRERSRQGRRPGHQQTLLESATGGTRGHPRASASRLGRRGSGPLGNPTNQAIIWEDDMITRRTLLKGTAAADGAERLWPMPAIAQGARIKLGYVSPQSGPLAAFAEADTFILSNFAQASVAANFEVIVKDSQSNPNRAAEVAKELIIDDEIDLMLVASTPETTNPVATTPASRGRAGDLDRRAMAALVHRPAGQSGRSGRAGSRSTMPTTSSGGWRT